MTPYATLPLTLQADRTGKSWPLWWTFLSSPTVLLAPNRLFSTHVMAELIPYWLTSAVNALQAKGEVTPSNQSEWWLGLQQPP